LWGSSERKIGVNGEEKLKLDYEQTHQLIRMFTDIRFKLLAFVPTLTGAAVALLGNIESGSLLWPWDSWAFS
jgi:hypothetical protein